MAKALPPIDSRTIVSRARALELTRFDEEYYGVDSRAGYFYNANGTTSRIWELIASPVSVAALCERLEQEYRVDPQACRRQVTEVLVRMREAGLVEATTPAASRGGPADRG